MRNEHSGTLGRIWIITAMNVVLLANILFGGETPVGMSAAHARALRKMSVDEYRGRLNANAKTLAEDRRISAEDAAVPTEEVFAVLTPLEKKMVAAGVGRVLERVLSMNRCTDIELAWGVGALVCLRQNDDEDSAEVIKRILETPVHRVETLEKTAQLEMMMRTVYEKEAARGEVAPNGFDRTSYKKSLTRRRLLLMRGDGR